MKTKFEVPLTVSIEHAGDEEEARDILESIFDAMEDMARMDSMGTDVFYSFDFGKSELKR